MLPPEYCGTITIICFAWLHVAWLYGVSVCMWFCLHVWILTGCLSFHYSPMFIELNRHGVTRTWGIGCRFIGLILMLIGDASDSKPPYMYCVRYHLHDSRTKYVLYLFSYHGLLGIHLIMWLLVIVYFIYQRSAFLVISMFVCHWCKSAAYDC